MIEHQAIEHDAVDHYVAKWRQREPELLQAEVFCPTERRQVFRLFGCLLAEWEDALLAPSDTQVASGKLLWWAEELAAGGKRHPLARGLVESGAAVMAMARAPLAAAELLESASCADIGAALSRCQNYAQAIAHAERQVSGTADPDQSLTSADDISISLLRRAAINAAAGHPLARDLLPMNLLARHATAEGDAIANPALHRDLAGELLSRQSMSVRLPLFRALRRRFDCYRLQQLQGGTAAPKQEITISPMRVLWMSWNAARRAQR